MAAVADICWGLMSFMATVVLPCMTLWEIGMGSFMQEFALLFLVAALVIYDIEDSGTRARQMVCLSIRCQISN